MPIRSTSGFASVSDDGEVTVLNADHEPYLPRRLVEIREIHKSGVQGRFPPKPRADGTTARYVSGWAAAQLLLPTAPALTRPLTPGRCGREHAQISRLTTTSSSALGRSIGLCRAGAGTGKSTTLVNRILSIVADDSDPGAAARRGGHHVHRTCRRRAA